MDARVQLCRQRRAGPGAGSPMERVEGTRARETTGTAVCARHPTPSSNDPDNTEDTRLGGELRRRERLPDKQPNSNAAHD